MSATLLLRVEFAVLAVAIVLLLAIPRTTTRIFGLPGDANGFWQRVLGGGALGLLMAAVAADQGWTRSGLGLGGFVAINLTLAFVIASLLVVGPAQPTRRAKVVLWLTAAVHALLGFTQLAYVS